VSHHSALFSFHIALKIKVIMPYKSHSSQLQTDRAAYISLVRTPAYLMQPVKHYHSAT